MTDRPSVDRGLRWLYTVSSTAAVVTAILFLGGTWPLIAAALRPGSGAGTLAGIQDNWLIVIFRLHGGFPGVGIGLLRGLDVLDIVILALVAVVYLGLYAALRRTTRIWAMVAAVQPFLGIALFLITRTAGRSAVMGAGLVISLVMLGSQVFDRATAYLGIAASILLLVGDFTAGAIPPTTVVAAIVGLGYVLLMVWLVLVARRLFRLGSGAVSAWRRLV